MLAIQPCNKLRMIGILWLIHWFIKWFLLMSVMEVSQNHCSFVLDRIDTGLLANCNKPVEKRLEYDSGECTVMHYIY